MRYDEAMAKALWETKGTLMREEWQDWGGDELVSDGLPALGAIALGISMTVAFCLLGILLGLVVLAL